MPVLQMPNVLDLVSSSGGRQEWVAEWIAAFLHALKEAIAPIV